MTLTVTVLGADHEELARTLEQEVLRLLQEGYLSGFDRNETGHYSFKIEDPQED